MNSDTFFSIGRYALIDAYYRNVWINVDEEIIAHEIRQVFWPKTVTFVFDLTCFTNYTHSLIDSEVALNWSIPPCENLLSPLTNITLVNPILSETQRTYTSKIIVNEPGNTLLSKARQEDLRNQMLFYNWILRKIKWRISDYSAAEKELFSAIRQIIQTEIHLESIKSELVKISSVSITGSQCLAAKILECLDSLYE